jgi:hypothetical protein
LPNETLNRKTMTYSCPDVHTEFYFEIHPLPNAKLTHYRLFEAILSFMRIRAGASSSSTWGKFFVACL